MLQRAASNAYSWWWASHIRTKQSKWLDNNLRDMEDRVKCILVLLGEEADSFSKRAEMYYKRRPEVIGSVEEAYRAYRALAERYDHISGELHKANHTIATAFPDQVQYAMLEEDDNNLPKAFTIVDPRRIHKSTVEGLMKKKEKGGKSGLKSGHENYAVPINKENAQAEISRLQKEILVLQTEKEFIKSSYEGGIAKYWDLEKQINDMQEKVCYFQEEFDESAVIEDDEARALMTATALQSCEETIIKLQEQQKISFSQAMVESERIKVSREKLKDIMRGYGKSLSDCTNSPDRNERNDATVNIYEVYPMKQEKIELQAIVDKIKEFFQKDTGIPVVEIAEKIDGLVNKIVDLELMFSSQTAQMDRLCLENTELEKTLQELEEENTVLTSGSDGLNDKLKQAEEELIRVQNIESSFQEGKSIVYSNFSETTTSFYDITYMLQSPSLIEHQTAAVPMHMLIDEATSFADTEPSGEHEKTKIVEDPQIDEATRKPGIDGFPDCSGKLELAILSDNNQLSSAYHEANTEKHNYVDDIEDLWHCGIQDESSFAAASVDKETAQNADHCTFSEHKRREAEHVHEIVGDAASSMQPHVVHSHERGVLEQSHHTSSNGPGDHDEKVKQVNSKQDSSKADHSISDGHSQQEMGKEEDSYTTENCTISNEKVKGFKDQEEDMAKLQQLLMNGLQDKEKVLLTEYTSILRNYKNAKRKITELEIKNQECLNEMTGMISELRSANAMKDKEIRSLRELFNSFADKNRPQIGHQMNPIMSLSLKSEMFRGHRRTPSLLPVHQRRQSASSISRMIVKNSSLKYNRSLEFLKEGDASHGVDTDPESLNLEDIKLTDVFRMENASPLEEKFRRDIDALLEENLEFWMKFSTSFQQIQAFQSKYEQLQSKIGKIINEDMLNPNNVHANDSPANAESEATEKWLREFKIELQVWLEQNAMFKGELQCRFASLCSIQEVINGAMEMDAETEEGVRFTSYQAAKFQGEVLNMKQENNKVAEELQAGLDHVKGLQAEVEKVMAKMINSSSLSGPKGSSSWRNASSKSRVPLRLFLFPTKKKKPSLFACVNPALQKQQSDMAFFTTTK